MSAQIQEIPLEAIARNAGHDAFDAGQSTNPAESPAMRDMFRRMPVGGRMLRLYAEFKAGYMTAAIHSYTKPGKTA